jgi:hypothetical protein
MTNPTTITMDGNKSVTASFVIDQFTLSTSATNGGITLSPAGGTYNYGTVVTLAAAANAHYHFTGWGGALSGMTNPTTITMDGNKSVTASFVIDQFTLSTSATNGGITLSPAGGTYNYGTVVTLTAAPNSCYNFSGWGGALSGTTNPITLTMDGNKSVTANFSAKQFTLSVSATNGSVSLSPAGGTYNCGTVVTLTATPSSCYRFTEWSGALSGTTNPTTITMDAAKSVTANFVINPYKVFFSANGGTGTMSSQTVSCGVPTQLNANAFTMFCNNFAGWATSPTGSVVYNNSANITATTNVILYAIWNQPSYTLTTSANDGTISRSPNQASYLCGTSVTFTATPASGFKFNGWSGDLSGLANPITIAMDGNKTVTANFVRRRLYVDNNKWGTGNNDGSSWADAFNGTDALDRALDAAESLSPRYGDEVEIWVATGIAGYPYLPSRNYDSNKPRRVGFWLRPYVKLYGGFTGSNMNETVANRQMYFDGAIWRMSYETILSGDLYNDDGDAANNGSGVFANNSYNVVIGSDYATIDGFTIRNGNADDPNGLFINGGGMDNWQASPTVRNCIFTNNRAIHGGGISDQYSNSLFENCAFISNYSVNEGGGAKSTNQSNTTFKRCTFISNTANGNYYGGAINSQIDAGYSVSIENSLFLSNGALVAAAVSCAGSGNAFITNCTFYNNWCSDRNVAVWITCNATIYNTILDNSAGGYSNLDLYAPSNSVVSNCNISAQTQWDGTNGNTHLPPQFVDPTSNNFRLLSTSPCINAGSSTPAAAREPDIEGYNRVNTPDIGAFEYH